MIASVISKKERFGGNPFVCEYLVVGVGLGLGLGLLITSWLYSEFQSKTG